MARGQLNTFLRRLRHVVRPRPDGPSDGQLLERFVQGRDAEAFELLVWRHGAMVMNVGLRVLRRLHDAEDAFQATFLTLARKAGTIGKGESVGSWLYKVAYRIALRSRNTAPTRSLPREPLPDASSAEPIADLLWRELHSVLDEEINQLPDKYRAAFVLCHLEGQTIEAAARSLGCPPATVGTRLARARELLRRRLVDRGFDLSVLLQSRHVFAALPAALVDSTVRAVSLGPANQAAAAGVISAHVAALTEGALRTMTLSKWTLATAVVLTLSLFGGSAVFVTHRVQAVEPAQAQYVPVALCANASAQAPRVFLKWKFEEGKPFYQVMTTTTTQSMKVMNNDVKQQQKQTFYFRWTPVKMDNGKWILKQKILGVKMDIDIGVAPIQYDSTKAANADSPLSDFFKALVGAEFTVTLDREHRVEKIEGREEFVKKLMEANKQMTPLLDQILSEKALMEMVEPTFAVVTGEPVEKGKKWTKQTTLDMGPIGKYTNDYTYTYEGQDKELDAIKVDTKLTYGPPEKPEGHSGLPFKIRSADLKSKSSTGMVWFNRKKGRVEKSTMDLELTGKLTIEIGGQKTEVELSQTQKTTVQTMDRNPLQPAKPKGDGEKEVK
jgi:RNA polymerase sigma factor (sigma-70 family)